MKNIGLLLSSVLVIECCVMTSEVRAVIPKTKLGELKKIIKEAAGTKNVHPAFVAKAGEIKFKEGDDTMVSPSLSFDLRHLGEKHDCHDGFIHFRLSGRQPATKDAALFSGARVTDEELNKKITSWYMYVFGGKDVEPYVDVKITAADAVLPKFAPDGRNIINFNESAIDIEKWKKDYRRSRNELLEKINERLEKINERLEKINEELVGDKEKQEEQLKKQKEKLEKQLEDFNKKFSQFDIEAVKRDFWTRFKTIASDPVGRVLLYRLLIEIWRTYDGDHSKISDENGAVEHFEGDEVSYFDKWHMNRRNKCRSLNIQLGNGGGFSRGGAVILINPNHNSMPTVVKVRLKEKDEDKVATLGGQQFKSSRKLVITGERYPADISLFHEMLHWLHFLRNPMRLRDEDTIIGGRGYAHILECYYGKKNAALPPEAVKAWKGNCDFILSGDEVRTILGAPDENDERIAELLPPIDEESFSDSQRELRNTFQWKRDSKFLNGDDVSENAYRLSRSTSDKPISMRFGHTTKKLTANLIDKSEQDRLLQVTTTAGFYPSTLEIAYNVAMNCYEDITGKVKNAWNFDLVPMSSKLRLAKVRRELLRCIKK